MAESVTPPRDSNSPPPDPDGRLGELRRQLYAREESEDIKQRRAELHQLGIRRKVLEEPGTSKPATFARVADIRAKRRKRWLVIGGSGAFLVLLFGGAVGGTLWYRARHNIRQDQIHVAIVAPTEFTAGDTVTYGITYRNDSFVDWQNIELRFEAPRGFRYSQSNQELKRDGKEYIATLGNLKSQAEGKIELGGQLIGEQNASLVAKAELFFTPANFPSGRFSNSALATTTITVVPVDVAIDTTDEAESGQRLPVTIHVRNNSSQVLSGAYLKINPAPGIQLATEDQQFSPGFSAIDSGWEIGNLEPLFEVERRLVMFVEGQPSERRIVEVELGLHEGEEKIVQRVQSHIVTITASALAIEQTYNGSEDTLIVEPGQAVHGEVHYNNIGNTGLKNVVVKVKFEGQGLDAATLRLPSGAYDPVERTITWTAASLPELLTLQPQQSGTISYDFTILPSTGFPTTGENLKNNILVATASLDSPDLITPTGEKRNLVSDRTVMSVTTKLALEASAVYDDGRLGLKSAGPVPPRAGEQTTYTVRFRVGSHLNDVGDLRLTAVLPDGVRYTDQHYATTGDIEFNDRTGELIWSLPQLKGLTGRTAPPEELHVQVAITPGENQRGSSVAFLNRATAEGTDLFTETAVQASVTDYPTTETAVQNQGTVQ